MLRAPYPQTGGRPPLCTARPSLPCKVGVFSRILRAATRHLHTSKIYRPITSSWLTGPRLQHRRSDLSQKVVFQRKNCTRRLPSFLAARWPAQKITFPDLESIHINSCTNYERGPAKPSGWLHLWERVGCKCV